MFARFIYQPIREKFTQDSDPIQDLGIGVKHQLKEWLKTEFYYNHGFKNDWDRLWICAYNGKTDFVKYLLSIGANVHYGGERALAFACDQSHLEIVKLLLDAGAKVYSTDDLCYRWAAGNGNTSIVKLLEEHMKKNKNDIWG